MSDVTGPVSTLPGRISTPPDGQLCDDCEKAPATIRVQGETDSFGAEFHDLCKPCHEAMKKAEAEAERIPVRCDWCKGEYMDNELRPQRDIDEGMCGRVYYVCKPCRDHYYESMREEDDYYDW